MARKKLRYEDVEAFSIENDKYEFSVLANMLSDTDPDKEPDFINTLLAKGFSYLNTLIAFMITFGAGLAFTFFSNLYRGEDSSFFWDIAAFCTGAIGGLFAAVIICGLFAILISIREELIHLKEATLEYQEEHLTMYARSQLREPFSSNYSNMLKEDNKDDKE